MLLDVKPKRRLLVVEDEGYVRDSLGALLEGRGYEVTLTDSVGSAVEALRKTPVDLVLADLNMPDGGGLELVGHARALGGGIPVVILTGYGTVGSAVECVKAGARDYLLKPADPDELEVVFERAWRGGPAETPLKSLGGTAGSPHDLIGKSAAWQAVVTALEAAARTNATVLLLGESGTGKRLLARFVHRLSGRASGPFVEVNGAAVASGSWGSELFGHCKGAVAGATTDRHGRIERANTGTLFVDEVTALPCEAQAALLRVAREGELHRLGDREPTRVDVRILAAAHCHPSPAIASDRFREDLVRPEGVVRIEVPPLRERPGDIPLLARHFLQQIAARLGRRAPSLTSDALRGLRAHHWPGNVRELRSVLERALVLEPEQGLVSLDLPPARPPASTSVDPEAAPDLTLRTSLGRRERSTVLEAIRRSRGIRKDAARFLGIDKRNLAYYLNKHRIDPDHFA